MWRNYLIGPDADSARTFYAPDLTTAFHLARLNGWGSKVLRCFGAP